MEQKYNHLVAEQEQRTYWQARDIYAHVHDQKPRFSIDTPPPTVSGSLHIGHIFSYTQTDIIARYKRMSGHAVFYPFGFDDNGLPTERFVEKKRSIVAHNLKRSEFIDLCLQETHVVEEQFKDLWQRVGLSVNWDHCYSTISPLARKISQESFIRLYKKGFVYRKNEPALYCTVCRTSVAQAELDDALKPSHFTTITFTGHDNKPLLIATTRPELLSACVALFYHPSDARYAHLAGTKARVPLYGFEVPVLADETVVPDKGTGLVMCCTFGDKNDIAWFKTHNLPYKQAIGFDGRMTELAGEFAGLKVKEARAKILEALMQQGLVVEQKAIEHAVNIHERCKHDIEFMALPQWFLSIMPHKQKLLELGEQITWYPEFMKSRYRNWVENISWDWGLSRQRFFGIPFPVWHCACGEVVLPDVKDLPLDPQEASAPQACTSCGNAELRPDTDVMDTWNTSSLTPYLCAALERGTTDGLFDEMPDLLPMSMRPQAHDIIRTWAFYTIVKAWMHHDTVPWNEIVISGHVLSTEKEKISKSQGNSPLQPENLLAAYPADAIRFWTASGSLGHDVPFSDNQLKIGQKLITKLWNAFRFVHEHCTESTLLDQEPKVGVNRWIAHQAAVCFARYERYFAQHEFGLALTAVEQFFWQDFCDNYLELIKDYLFNPQQHPAHVVAEIKQMLFTIGLRILQLYAPYMPYVTEALYRQLYQQKIGAVSLHVTQFSTMPLTTEYPHDARVFDAVGRLVSMVRKLKSDNQLSLKTELMVLSVHADQDALALLEGEEAIIRGVTRARELMFAVAEGETALHKDGETYKATVLL